MNFMDFAQFERRVRGTPDLVLGWTYWNAVLPETTGRALWMLFLLPAMRGMAESQGLEP